MKAKHDLTILYVEDEELIRSSMGSFFNRRFERLHYAFDGKEGLEMYLKHKPDIIITDVEMPTMDGFEMIKIIRKENKEIPVIFTTAFSEASNKAKATDLNAFAYLVKPIDREKFDEILNDVAGQLKTL